MPYTQREVRFLLSSASPFSNKKKDEVKAELHSDPALGHQRRGSEAMKRGSRMADRFAAARKARR